MRVIATAGHVDHGKSTLVQALTGINPDRLREEQERQMTIDLGFAWLTLENGEEVGIVDVPGHRDFIENMLAGVGAVDATLFVIAADEGIMPQTREHLVILELLQIPRGIIALTKVDLVDEEWLELVTDETRALFDDTRLKDAPIIPVSSVSGRGLSEIKAAIGKVLGQAPAHIDVDRPRLPIDRVFTLTGFGTVVTGTLIGGSFKEGQEVEVQPKGIKARIRGLQSHKNSLKQASPGGRVALNLSGTDKSDIERGDTVSLPGQWKPSKVIDAYFQLLADIERPLKHNQEVKFFHGTTQRMAKVRLIGQPQLKAGEEGWIQLILTEAIVADRGDRYILRRPSPGVTLGGGQIVDPEPKRRYRLKDRSPIEHLEKLLAGDSKDYIFEQVRAHGPIRADDVIQKAGLDRDDGMAILQELQLRGELIGLGTDTDLSQVFLISRAAWMHLQHQSDEILQEFHRQYPMRLGMPIEEYRKRMKLDSKWSNRLIHSAVSEGWIMQADNAIHHPAHAPKLTEKQDAAVRKLLNDVQAQPFNTPSRREMIDVVGEDVLHHLIWKGVLVGLSEDVLLAKDTYLSAVETIREALEIQGTLTVAEVRDIFKTSRKYALALMEHLDALGITIREGDVRRLKS